MTNMTHRTVTVQLVNSFMWVSQLGSACWVSIQVIQLNIKCKANGPSYCNVANTKRTSTFEKAGNTANEAPMIMVLRRACFIFLYVARTVPIGSLTARGLLLIGLILTTYRLRLPYLGIVNIAAL